MSGIWTPIRPNFRQIRFSDIRNLVIDFMSFFRDSLKQVVTLVAGHSMPPASSSPTDSNSSNGSDLSSSPPLGSSGGSYLSKPFNGSGGITLYGSSISSSSLLGLSHHHHHHQVGFMNLQSWHPPLGCILSIFVTSHIFTHTYT